MRTLIIHIESGDVPMDVVRDEIDSSLNDLMNGDWADRYGQEGDSLDFGFRLFDTLGEAEAWQETGEYSEN